MRYDTRERTLKQCINRILKHRVNSQNRHQALRRSPKRLSHPAFVPAHNTKSTKANEWTREKSAHRHEFGHERFQVENRLAPQLHPMLLRKAKHCEHSGVEEGQQRT